jgi:hypothetical protein
VSLAQGAPPTPKANADEEFEIGNLKIGNL